MDPVRKRFEQYIEETIDTYDFNNTDPEDLLVYSMILQEYIKYCNKGLNYEKALHEYNETLFKILGRS